MKLIAELFCYKSKSKQTVFRDNLYICIFLILFGHFLEMFDDDTQIS